MAISMQAGCLEFSEDYTAIQTFSAIYDNLPKYKELRGRGDGAYPFIKGMIEEIGSNMLQSFLKICLKRANKVFI